MSRRRCDAGTVDVDGEMYASDRMVAQLQHCCKNSSFLNRSSTRCLRNPSNTGSSADPGGGSAKERSSAQGHSLVWNLGSGQKSLRL